MYFKYNGKDSKQWAYDLSCSLIIEKLDSVGVETLKATNKYVEKAVRIKKVNKFTGEITHFSKLEIDVINRWLFEDQYKCLEAGLYCYNAIFKRRRLMWSDNGFIDLIVRLTPNALSRKTIHNFTVKNGEKIVDINNKSNISGLNLDTELQIKLKDDSSSSITIENITTRQKIGFKELNTLDSIYVNSKNEYISSNDSNIYSKFDGTYITLIQGINKIKIKSNGFVTVLICFQMEFNLEEVWLNE